MNNLNIGDRVYAILEFPEGGKALLSGEIYYTTLKEVKLKKLYFIKNSDPRLILNEEKTQWRLRLNSGWEIPSFSNIIGVNNEFLYDFNNEADALLAYEVI